MTAETRQRVENAQAVELYRFDGTDVWQEGDERARIRGYFPLSPGTPNAGDVSGDGLMIVCMEIEPGNYLPTHRDSNEELLLVTAGRVEASVGDETVELSEGECTIVPEMAPHGLRNVGEEPARVIGFFPNDELTATFEEPLMPFGSEVVSVGGHAEGENEE
ncbi:cupin domain-containing protein [Halegenticoccus soli]|uniref:cupin domain-containing protein n=1 Tax=Halegenticoccus soli TaxID=1985678 RepID=UPI000C6D81CA|nr:cupin domain-containing protein [Halegenticoccus soli]